MKERSSENKALLMFISSMLIFGTIGLLRRSIPLPSSLIACARGLIGGCVLLIYRLFRKERDRIKPAFSTVAGLCISGAIMGFNWILLFEAYNHTTVAVATLCYYMQPTIVVLLSPLLFQERLTCRKLFFALIAVAGMVLVSGVAEGKEQHQDFHGAILGLGAAALYAVVVILNKKITGIDALQKTVIQLFSAGIVMIPYMLLTENILFDSISMKTAGLLLVAGIVHTGIAYILYFGSLTGLKAQTAAIFSYIDPVSAMLFSAALLGEPLSLYGIFGALMIIGSAIGYAVPERNK